MNRRDFILRSFKWGSVVTMSAILSPLLMDFKTPISSSAPVSKDILFTSDLPIVENHFDFSSHRLRSHTDKIILHHSDIEGTDDINAIDIHHMHQENGWSGIGYHMYIHKSGLIETGRPLDYEGAHTYRYNDSSVGICLAGNFEDEQPTQAQLTSASKLIAVLCKIYNLTPNEDTVFAHRDFNQTACPGENLYEKLPTIRENARQFMTQV